MSQGVASTGTCMAVSAVAPATDDAAGYAALTWTDWGEVTQFGDIGPEANIQSYRTVCDGTENKRPTSVNYGTMSIEAAEDPANAAQIVLRASAYAVPITRVYARLTLSNGGILYFQGYPASFKLQIGDADSVLMRAVTFEVNGAPIEV